MIDTETLDLRKPNTTKEARDALMVMAGWSGMYRATVAASAARSRHAARGFATRDSIDIRCVRSPAVMRELTDAGFVLGRAGWKLTRERAIELDRAAQAVRDREANAQKPENVRRVEVSVWERNKRDLPTEHAMKDGYIEAAQWAAKRLANPENDYTRAELVVRDGNGELLLAETLRITRETTFRKPQRTPPRRRCI